MIRMATFQTNLDTLVESDRIGKVEPVRDLILRYVIFMDNSSTEGVRVFLHTPALGKIVLTPCAMQ